MAVACQSLILCWAILNFAILGSCQTLNCSTQPQVSPRRSRNTCTTDLCRRLEDRMRWINRTRDSEANQLWRKVSSGHPHAGNYSYCWFPPKSPSLSNLSAWVAISENMFYSQEEHYGHPQYCPEQRHNLLAQPQYSELNFLHLTAQNDNWEVNLKPAQGSQDTLPWVFKGMYYVGPPGRTGLRYGNPGYPHRTNAAVSGEPRDPIINGQVAYIEDLTSQGLYDTNTGTCFHGPDDISNTQAFAMDWGRYCIGWDIEMSQGVWEECSDNHGRNRAHANYMAAGLADYTSLPLVASLSSGVSPPQLFKGTYLDGAWRGAGAWVFLSPTAPPLTYSSNISWHNCSTCTGKFNFHTRDGLAEFDEGPNDSTADPANPWTFTVSMNYPTYVPPSNMTGFDFVESMLGNLSVEDYWTSYNEIINITGASPADYNSSWAFKFDDDKSNASGYSPSNHGGVGTWGALTERGIHLHYPPENWGASFEPTRALVISVNKPCMHASCKHQLS